MSFVLTCPALPQTRTLGASTYAALLSKVSTLRKTEGLRNDKKVVCAGYILHGTPGKYLETLWDLYQKCVVVKFRTACTNPKGFRGTPLVFLLRGCSHRR